MGILVIKYVENLNRIVMKHKNEGEVNVDLEMTEIEIWKVWNKC
jgi:hypothetical protein